MSTTAIQKLTEEALKFRSRTYQDIGYNSSALPTFKPVEYTVVDQINIPDEIHPILKPKYNEIFISIENFQRIKETREDKVYIPRTPIYNLVNTKLYGFLLKAVSEGGERDDYIFWSSIEFLSVNGFDYLILRYKDGITRFQWSDYIFSGKELRMITFRFKVGYVEAGKPYLFDFNQGIKMFGFSFVSENNIMCARIQTGRLAANLYPSARFADMEIYADKRDPNTPYIVYGTVVNTGTGDGTNWFRIRFNEPITGADINKARSYNNYMGDILTRHLFLKHTLFFNVAGIDILDTNDFNKFNIRTSLNGINFTFTNPQEYPEIFNNDICGIAFYDKRAAKSLDNLSTSLMADSDKIEASNHYLSKDNLRTIAPETTESIVSSQTRSQLTIPFDYSNLSPREQMAYIASYNAGLFKDAWIKDNPIYTEYLTADDINNGRFIYNDGWLERIRGPKDECSYIIAFKDGFLHPSYSMAKHEANKFKILYNKPAVETSNYTFVHFKNVNNTIYQVRVERDSYYENKSQPIEAFKFIEKYVDLSDLSDNHGIYLLCKNIGSVVYDNRMIYINTFNEQFYFDYNDNPYTPEAENTRIYLNDQLSSAEIESMIDAEYAVYVDAFNDFWYVDKEGNKTSDPQTKRTHSSDFYFGPEMDPYFTINYYLIRTEDDQYRIVLEDESYYGQDMWICPNTQFRYMQDIIVDENQVSIDLSRDFVYCRDFDRYLVFVNGKMIDIAHCKLVMPRPDLPFDIPKMYTTLYFQPGDKIEIFYLPSKLYVVAYESQIETSGNILIDGNIDNFASIQGYLSKDTSLVFVNGELIDKNKILDMNFNQMKIINDIGTVDNLIVFTYMDTSYYISQEIVNAVLEFYASNAYKKTSIKDVVDQNTLNGINIWETLVDRLSESNKNILFNLISSYIVPVKENIYNNSADFRAMIYEIVRDHYGIGVQSGVPFVYEFDDDILGEEYENGATHDDIRESIQDTISSIEDNSQYTAEQKQILINRLFEALAVPKYDSEGNAMLQIMNALTKESFDLPRIYEGSFIVIPTNVGIDMTNTPIITYDARLPRVNIGRYFSYDGEYYWIHNHLVDGGYEGYIDSTGLYIITD